MRKILLALRYFNLLTRLLKQALSVWQFTRPVRRKAAQGAKAAAGRAAAFARAQQHAYAQWKKARRTKATSVAFRMLEQAA